MTTGSRDVAPWPDRVPEFLLLWLVRPLGGAGESMVGDLRQERALIARECGGGVASRWYARQSLGIAARAARDRLRRRGPFYAGNAMHGGHGNRRRNREAWSMKEFVGEIRYAVRSLSKARQYALAAMLTLALAVAANIVVFTVVNSVLLQPLPYASAERLVILNQTAQGLGYPEFGISPGLYYQYRENSPLIEQGALYTEQTANLTEGDASPERVNSLASTHTLFSLLGRTPVLGRTFTAEEDQPEGSMVVVLSHALWLRRYGGDASIIGQSIRVDGVDREVIGVMPPEFSFPGPDQAIYLPLGIDLATSAPGNFAFNAVARLRPGSDVDQLRSQLDAVIARLPEFYPDANEFHAFVEAGKLASIAEPLKSSIVGDLERPLWLLLGTAAFVLLIACANVTNLFLVRAEASSRDIAVRAALGAGRFRLTRHFLSESLVLATGAGGLGMALGAVGVMGLLRVAPSNLPRLSEIGVDPLVLAYATGLIGVIALLLALVPAVRMTSPSVMALVSRSGFRTTAGRDRFRARQALVVVQTALALVLLIGSGLMLRTFAQLRSIDPGFDASDILTFRITLPAASYEDAESAAFMHDRVVERLRALPGVQAVGSAQDMPLTGRANGTAFAIEDHPVAPGQLPPILGYTYVSEGYFEAMRIPVLSGEVLRSTGLESSRRSVVVSRMVAERFWPGVDAVGRRLAFTSSDPAAEPLWFTVVGVVSDVRDRRLQEEPTGLLYFPTLASVPDGQGFPVRSMTYAVRATRPETMGAAVRGEVWALDRNLPIAMVRTLESVVSESMAQTSFTMLALVVAAALALFLGAIGLYGVISYIVTQRTREIGLRIALGAESAVVRRMVVWQGFRMAAVGLAVGMLAAFGLTRLLESLLFGTSPTDPLTFGAVTALLGAVAFVASWVPALRASRLDPARTLQVD